MWNYECNETEIMNLRDSMEGVVPEGTKVFCSIKRWARENRKILVNVDSIAYESDMKRAA